MKTDKVNKDWTFVDQETGEVVDFKKIGTDEKTPQSVEVRKAITIATLSKQKERILHEIIDEIVKPELRGEVFNLLLKDVRYVDDFISFYSKSLYTQMFAIVNTAKTQK